MPDVNDSIPTPIINPTDNTQQDSTFTDSLTTEQLLNIQANSTLTEGKIISAKEMYGTKSTLLAAPKKPYGNGEGIQREYPLGSSWAFLPVIGVILLALLLIRYTRGYLSQLFTLVISHKAAQKQYRSNLQNFNRILLMLMLFSIVPATIFITYVLNSFPNQLSIDIGYELFIVVGAFLLAFSVLKSIILSIAGVLTYEERLIQELRYNGRIFVGVWGITVLPFIILLTVSDNHEDKLILFYIIVGLCILLYILYLIRSLQLFISEKVSTFFWILYLCTLELLPVLLVFDYLFPFR